MLQYNVSTYPPTTMDPKYRQRLHIIQKQMMIIVNLLVVAIAIIYAPDKEQLAQLRLSYHTSILTGEGWVMELLARHPWCIYTELEVSHEVFIYV